MKTEIEIGIGQYQADFVVAAAIDGLVKLAKMLALMGEAARIADHRAFGDEKARFDGIARCVHESAVVDHEYAGVIVLGHDRHFHPAYGKTRGSRRVPHCTSRASITTRDGEYNEDYKREGP